MNNYSFQVTPSIISRWKVAWKISKLFDTLETMQLVLMEETRRWKQPVMKKMDMQTLECLAWLFELYNSDLHSYDLLIYCVEYLDELVHGKGQFQQQVLLDQFLSIARDCGVLD